MGIKQFFAWENKQLKKLDIWDIGLVKLATLMAAFLIAQLWPWLIVHIWWIFVVIFVLACIRPVMKMFFLASVSCYHLTRSR